MSGLGKVEVLTTARLGQLRESQGGIVGGEGLKGNVTVPLRIRLLLGAQPVDSLLLVVLFALHGADDADLGIVAAELPARVEQRVDVQAGLGRAAGEPAEALNQLLLQVICQVILRAEHHDTALRDFKIRSV